mmetsp:Transcript_8113/g.25338  ORF Transcript_8113/g.25338 Transcript_8113/m.25338 type:complete len:203 (-) Transcript_8113:626-1234(-)
MSLDTQGGQDVEAHLMRSVPHCVLVDEDAVVDIGCHQPGRHIDCVSIEGVLAPLSIPHRPGKDSAGGEPHPRLMAQLSQRAHDLQSAQHAAHRVVLVLVGRRAEGRKEYGALVVDVETREHALEASNLSSDGAKHLLGLCNDGIEHFMLPLMVQAKDAYEEDGRKTKVREPIHPCSAQTVLDGFGHIGCQPERGFGRALDET